MKNIEKYHETKAALEAYNKLDFKKVPFDMWLELEYEEPRAMTLLEAAEEVARTWDLQRQYGSLSIVGNSIRNLADAIKREKAKPVLNFNKYKTAKDALTGFNEMCSEKHCDRCQFSAEINECNICKLNWLYAEAGR